MSLTDKGDPPPSPRENKRHLKAGNFHSHPPKIPPTPGRVLGRVSAVPRGEEHRGGAPGLPPHAATRRGRGGEPLVRYQGNGETQRERRLKSVVTSRRSLPAYDVDRLRAQPSSPFPPQHGGARLLARSARGGRPLRSGPTTLWAYGAAAFSFLRGPRIESPTSSGTGPGLRRARALQPHRRSPENRPRRSPQRPPSTPSPPPGALRPPWPAPPARLHFLVEPKGVQAGGGGLPFSATSPPQAAVPLPFSSRPGASPVASLTHRGEGWGISPPPPRVSAEPSRHFLLATAPERWAGALLPRYHRNRHGGQRLPRAPRVAHGSRRTSVGVGSASRPGGARCLTAWRWAGRARRALSTARRRGPVALQLRGGLSPSPHSRGGGAARRVPVPAALGRRTPPVEEKGRRAAPVTSGLPLQASVGSTSPAPGFLLKNTGWSYLAGTAVLFVIREFASAKAKLHSSSAKYCFAYSDFSHRSTALSQD